MPAKTAHRLWPWAAVIETPAQLTDKIGRNAPALPTDDLPDASPGGRNVAARAEQAGEDE